MSQLLNIFLDPGKAFAELKERPTFLVPALVVMVSTFGALGLYFLTVDPAWFVEHQITQALQVRPELTRADLEAGSAFMQPMVVAGIVFVFGGLFFVLMYLLAAVYYMLAGKISGAAIGFRHGLALTAWAAMPLLLGALVLAAGVLTSPPQVALESLQMLNVDPLLVQLPIDSPWKSLASSFSLLNFWCLFLSALGWKTWTRSGWGAALFVTGLPFVLIFGTMALFAAL